MVYNSAWSQRLKLTGVMGCLYYAAPAVGFISQYLLLLGESGITGQWWLITINGGLNWMPIIASLVVSVGFKTACILVQILIEASYALAVLACCGLPLFTEGLIGKRILNSIQANDELSPDVLYTTDGPAILQEL